MVVDRTVAVVQPALAAEQDASRVGGRAGLTQGRTSPAAVAARPTRGDERGDDVLAGGQSRHTRTDRGDLAGDLVAENHRDRPGPRPVDDRKVRVAETRGPYVDEYLPGAGRVELEIADRRWLADLLEDSGANVHAEKETAFAALTSAPRRPLL